jgi:hypothetical protein
MSTTRSPGITPNAIRPLARARTRSSSSDAVTSTNSSPSRYAATTRSGSCWARAAIGWRRCASGGSCGKAGPIASRGRATAAPPAVRFGGAAALLPPKGSMKTCVPAVPQKRDVTDQHGLTRNLSTQTSAPGHAREDPWRINLRSTEGRSRPAPPSKRSTRLILRQTRSSPSSNSRPRTP